MADDSSVKDELPEKNSATVVNNVNEMIEKAKKKATESILFTINDKDKDEENQDEEKKSITVNKF